MFEAGELLDTVLEKFWDGTSSGRNRWGRCGYGCRSRVGETVDDGVRNEMNTSGPPKRKAFGNSVGSGWRARNMLQA
jgi:hypothetical protein